MAQAELDAALTSAAANRIQVLALTDWDSSQAIAGSDPPTAFPDGVQLWGVPGAGAELELIAEGAEANLDDPAVLTELVATVFKAFPSRRRALVLWDHGGAWSGGFGTDTRNGTLAAPQAMPVEAIPAAVEAGLAAAGITASPPLDLVAFDTCLMAGAEVITPFRNLSRVFIANAEIDYGAGWDYTATLSHMARNPEEDVVALARTEVRHWELHHAGASPNDALLRSHVALDLSQVDAFVAATSSLTRALTRSTTFEAIELGRSGFFALPPYASQFENAGSSAPGLRDFGQILDALTATRSDATVASAAASARTALDALVIARSEGSLRADSNQAGIHVELSLATELTPAHLASYGERASEWARASGWQNVLTSLAGAADATAPSILHAVRNAGAASVAAPPVLDFSTLDADTAKGVVYLGTSVDTDTVAVLGIVSAGLLEPASDYSFGWDGTVMTLSDGQPAMLDIWLDVGAGATEPVLMVPGLLTAGADELVANLVFGGNEGSASVAVVSLGDVASTLGLGEIVQAYPGATFTPIYYAFSTSSGESTTLTGEPLAIPASGVLAFGAEYMPAGSYSYFTSVTDVWGNAGLEVDPFELVEPLGP